MAVAIGIAHPAHDAWVLAAFEPTEAEKTRLEGLRQRLGFDPTTHGHRLTSGKETDPQGRKKALRELCADDAERSSRSAASISIEGYLVPGLTW